MLLPICQAGILIDAENRVVEKIKIRIACPHAVCMLLRERDNKHGNSKILISWK